MLDLFLGSLPYYFIFIFVSACCLFLYILGESCFGLGCGNKTKLASTRVQQSFEIINWFIARSRSHMNQIVSCNVNPKILFVFQENKM